MLKDKENLALEILKLKCDSQRRAKDQPLSVKESTQQDIKVLKQMMKSIEESSIKEKNFFQRQIVKKDEEINILKYEINQLRASEKSLMTQLKITGESFKNRSRNSSINDSFKRGNQSVSKRSASQESGRNRPARAESPFFNYNYINSKKSSQNSSRKPATNQTNQYRNRGRSNSLDRSTKSINQRGISPANSRGISPASSINSLNSINSYGSGYSMNGSKKRFNPTDYVRARKEKFKELEQKKLILKLIFCIISYNLLR